MQAVRDDDSTISTTNSDHSTPCDFADSGSEGEGEVDSLDKRQQVGKSRSSKGERKQERKSRKTNWKESHLDDMVQIIVSNEHYNKNRLTE